MPNADMVFFCSITADTAKAEDLCSVLIPDEMTQVEYLALNAYDVKLSEDEADIGANDYIAIYQDKAPEYVVGVEVIKVDGKTHEPILSHGEPIVVTQPVEGETYAINSITFDDGTVITGAEEISKYVTLTVKATKANGNVVKFDNVDKGDLAFRIAPDKYDDCFITATVNAIKGTGVFGDVTWGEDAEALAVQQRLAGANRYETAMKVADQMKPTGGFENIFVATGESYALNLAFGWGIIAASKNIDTAYEFIDYTYEKEWYDSYIKQVAPVFVPVFTDAKNDPFYTDDVANAAAVGYAESAMGYYGYPVDTLEGRILASKHYYQFPVCKMLNNVVTQGMTPQQSLDALAAETQALAESI